MKDIKITHLCVGFSVGVFWKKIYIIYSISSKCSLGKLYLCLSVYLSEHNRLIFHINIHTDLYAHRHAHTDLQAVSCPLTKRISALPVNHLSKGRICLLFPVRSGSNCLLLHLGIRQLHCS